MSLRAPPPPNPWAPVRAVVSAALAAGAEVPAVRAEPVLYTLDPTHSAVHFEVRHFDTSTLRGRFALLQGEVTLDRAARSGRVQLVLDTARVSTGVPPLDARLREPDLFDSAAQPQAYFVAERLEVDAAGSVTGKWQATACSPA